MNNCHEQRGLSKSYLPAYNCIFLQNREGMKPWVPETIKLKLIKYYTIQQSGKGKIMPNTKIAGYYYRMQIPI